MNLQSENPMQALVVFAARENLSELMATLEAAKLAVQARGGGVRIEVLVNGNPLLAKNLVANIEADSAEWSMYNLRIWFIKMGDKAHAWNQYFHKIWANEELAFFIDGYVRLMPLALQQLGSEVMLRSHALGGTGVPTFGRTANALRAAMLKHGGFHGNLCCIKGNVLRDLRDSGFSIPLGLYRTDSLMGAVLSFNLNPAKHSWDHTRIFVHPQASWQTDPKHIWRLNDVIAKIKRTRRQARGILENQAVKQHLEVQKLPPHKLPTTASELVIQWMENHDSRCLGLMLRHPLTFLAARDIRANQSWSDAHVKPILMWPYVQPSEAV